jgi:hypothetical protein
MLVIEIVKTWVPTSGFILGLPSRLLLQFSPNMKKKTSLVRCLPSIYPLGGTTKKRQAGLFRETFWGAEGVGAEVKITQERTAAAHALPHVDNTDGRV